MIPVICSQALAGGGTDGDSERPCAEGTEGATPLARALDGEPGAGELRTGICEKRRRFLLLRVHSQTLPKVAQGRRSLPLFHSDFNETRKGEGSYVCRWQDWGRHRQRGPQ